MKMTQTHNSLKTLVNRWCARLVALPFLLVFLFATDTVQATHIVGGDLTYRCLSGGFYEIRLTLRRDCFLGAVDAQFDDPASVGFFSAADNQLLTFVDFDGQLLMPFRAGDDTLNQTFISDCTIAGNDVCVHQTTYVDTVFLPAISDGYILAYQRCCRNASLNNVVNPLNTGMTITARLDHSDPDDCSNSPQFGPYPPIYICIGDTIDYSAGIENPEIGDSLVYCLITPNAGGDQVNNRPQPPPEPPYDTVNWVSPPYSLSNLLGGDPLTINSQTGEITGVPNTIGQFLVGVCVSVYNDGVLVSTAQREWQYNVRMCRDVPVADFEVNVDIGGDTVNGDFLSCNTLSVNFINNSLNADEYLWIFDYPNANSQTSNDTNPTNSYPVGGFFNVALIVNDADSICFDTSILSIGVFRNEIEAGFDVAISSCTEEAVIEVTDLSEDPDPNYDIESWEYILEYGDNIDTSSAQNPIFILDSSYTSVSLTQIVTSSNGCTDTIVEFFDVNIIQIPFVGDTLDICFGDSTRLLDGADDGFDYMWSPEDSLDLTLPHDPIAFPAVNTTYFVTVTDGLCTVEGSVLVRVQQLPDLAFEIDTDCKSLKITMTNLSTGGIAYFWDFGDPAIQSDTSNEVSPMYTYDNPGVYTVTLFSADGCDVSESMQVTVSIIDDRLDSIAISCFTEPVLLNPDGNPAYAYAWTPAEFLDDPTSPNPTASVTESTWFFVTITDTLLPGCSIEDSIQVIVPPDFNLGAPNDTAYCGAPLITLIGSNDDLIYKWLDLDGNVIEEGSVLMVTPDTVTSYVLMGTDGFGCSKMDTITLSPTFFDLELSPDTIICLGDTISIGVMNFDTSQVLLFEWGPPNLILSDPTLSMIDVNPDVDQTYSVTITNMTLGCELIETIDVLVSSFDYQITADQIICLGDKITLSVNNLDTTDLSFVWEPGGVVGNDPMFMPMETTTYFVTITNDNYGCVTEDSVTVTVSWFTPPDLQIFIDPDTINITESSVLSTNQDPGLTYMWSGPALDNPNSATPTASPTETAEYCVTVTNADGCVLTGCTNLNVRTTTCEDIFIPNAFSPNGDGENDELCVRSFIITTMELIIYNRWGEQVFRSTNQGNCWNGEFEGEPLTPDVYGYHLQATCLDGEEFVDQGNITLFR